MNLIAILVLTGLAICVGIVLLVEIIRAHYKMDYHVPSPIGTEELLSDVEKRAAEIYEHTGKKNFADNSVGYYVNGKLHRSDGPAKIEPDGQYEYWINGKQVSFMAFEMQYMLLHNKEYEGEEKHEQKDEAI